MHGNSSTKLSHIRTIYWFSFYDMRSPSVRYRAYYPLRHIKNRYGIKYRLIFPGYQFSRVLNFIFSWLSALFDDATTSLIVIQKVRSDFIYANLLKLLTILKPENILYDTDDADFLEHSPDSINFFMNNCSLVSAGSEALFNHCLGFNQNVILNTSPVPESLHNKHTRNQEFTIGWIGDYGGGHRQSLQEQLFTGLHKINFRIRLILLGVTKEEDRLKLTTKFRDCHHINLELPEISKWNNESEIQRIIAGFDVGIATLLDEQLHRCKSAFKLKQYMNAGVPVLSTNLPENNLFIKNGINGFICDSCDDYLSALKRIKYMSDEAYEQICIGAKSTVHLFDLHHYCNILLNNIIYPVPVQSKLQ